jgi:pSer/pThr/pTyr-binding forkhead associated (FHA) protein
MVSRHHAAIHAKDGMWVIKDLSSTNGIEVNGVFVNNIMLKNMDVVSIAPFSLVFEVTENDDAWRPVAETQFATTRVALTPPEASERRPAPPTVQGKSASPKPSKP